MPVPLLREVLHRLRQRVAADHSAVTDAQLLRRYVQTHAEEAFRELVCRHGPMVLGVCRRVLRDEQAAEDAFQATFLVLVKRARSVQWHESIAGWLYEVAWRTAQKARHRPTTVPLPENIPTTAAAPAADAALGEALDTALASLPAHYRAVLVLCGCEGKSNEGAAQVLGCAVGTVKSRLHRGRELLRRRLLRQGVVVPAAMAATLPETLASAAVPAALLRGTLDTTLAFAAGTALPSAPTALALAVLRGLWLARIKLALGVLLCGAVLIAGVGVSLAVLATPRPAEPAPERAAPPGAAAPRAPGAAAPVAAADALESPLPAGAVVRLGTSRFRTGGYIFSMAVSADGKRLLTLGGGTALIWDLATGQLLHHISEKSTILATALSRDGCRLLNLTYVNLGVSSNTTILRVREAATGKLVRVIEANEYIRAFALAPDDRTVALELATMEGRPTDNPLRWKSHLELRDVNTDRILHRFGEVRNSSPMSRLLFTPDGRTLIAVSARESNEGRSLVRRFDCATGRFKSQMEIEGWSYSSPLVTDGKTLAVTSYRIWDLETGKDCGLVTSDKRYAGVYALGTGGKLALLGIPARNAWVEDATGGSVREVEPHRLVLWDVQAGKEIRQIPGFLHGNPMLITPDGKTILNVAGVYGTIQGWSVATGKETPALDAPIESTMGLAFSPDQKLIATLDWQAVRIWEAATGKQVRRLPLARSPNHSFMRFTPDGKRLLHAGFDRIVVLDTATWKPARPDLTPKDLAFLPLDLSPDGKLFAQGPSFRAPGPVVLNDWQKETVVGRFLRHETDLAQNGPLAFSVDGKWLASAAYPIRYGPPPKAPPTPLEPAGDGKNKAAAPAPPPPPPARGERLRTPARIQLWNVATRKLVRDWDPNIMDLVRLQFSRDGKTLVGSYQSGLVLVWDPATGKERLRLQHVGQQPFNFWSSLAPDGKLLATADHGNTLVRFWDLTRGKQVGEFRGQCGYILGVSFSPDGSRLAVWCSDTTTLLVDVRKIVGKH